MIAYQSRPRMYTRRGLAALFEPTDQDASQPSSSNAAPSKFNRDLIQYSANRVDSLSVKLLSGEAGQGDLHAAAGAYSLLGSHFRTHQIDKLLPYFMQASNTQATADPPNTVIDALRSRNSRIPLDQLPPIQLATGDDYQATLKWIRRNGVSGAFYTASDFVRIAAKSMEQNQIGMLEKPRLDRVAFHSQVHFESISCITKKNVCNALTALTGATLALAFPFFVLCSAGALAAVIASVIATEGLAGPAAAALIAEGEEVCAALDSASMSGLAYTIGLITFAMKC